MMLHAYTITISQRGQAALRISGLYTSAMAASVAMRLEQSGQPAAAGLIREVFIHKSHS